MDENGISKKDYEEACCCTRGCGSIPTERVIHKLDEYFARNDYSGARRHLEYWIGEAQLVNDDNGLLFLFNECIGLFRKLNDPDNAMLFASRALECANKLGLQDSVTMATTYINIATAHCAFDQYSEALPYYENAKIIYEQYLSDTDDRLGGLYNNMALCKMALNCFDDARALFTKALSVMENVDGGKPNMAITYCNLADLAEKENEEMSGENIINELMEKAFALLDEEKDRKDGAYAYACEKCAQAFGHHGFFVYESELMMRARSIYEGN